MSKRRRNFTHQEAQQTLESWLAKNKMTPARFRDWLGERGIVTTHQTCSVLAKGQITPGPMFKTVFREITGIQLVNGLIEEE